MNWSRVNESSNPLTFSTNTYEIGDDNLQISYRRIKSEKD